MSSTDFTTAAGTMAICHEDQLLATGTGCVAIGTFAINDDEITSADMDTLLSNFTQFGSCGRVLDFAGIVAADVSAPLVKGDRFVGNPIYVDNNPIRVEQRNHGSSLRSKKLANYIR